MKNSLYLSAALMVIAWVIIHFAFHIAHAYILLLMATITVSIRLVFNKQLDRY